MYSGGTSVGQHNLDALSPAKRARANTLIDAIDLYRLQTLQQQLTYSDGELVFITGKREVQ